MSEAGPTVTITVSRVDASDGAASVDYATSDGTATAGTLNWADGNSANKTFTVDITDDYQVEGAEFLRLTLSNASGAELGSPKIAAIVIGDNDSDEEVHPSSKVILWWRAQQP